MGRDVRNPEDFWNEIQRVKREKNVSTGEAIDIIESQSTLFDALEPMMVDTIKLSSNGSDRH